MPLKDVGLCVLLLAVAWALLHLAQHLLRRPRFYPPPKVTWNVSGISLHVATTAANNWPARWVALCRIAKRRYRSCYDLGAVLAVLGMVLAQGFLLWATAKSVAALWSTFMPASTLLVKRSLVARAETAQGREGLILRPLVRRTDRKAR